MADQWHYGRNGQQFGPVTAQQLKQLVVSGQLQQTDLVWKQGMAQWVPAQNIKGLTFAALETPPMPEQLVQATIIHESQHTRQRSPVAPGRSANEFVANAAPFWNQCREHPAFIGILLFFCFPVGLFLVWRHPSWTPRTKWIWTGAWAGMMLFGLIGSHLEEQKAAKNLAEANALWTSGKKADAVDKYRLLLHEHNDTTKSNRSFIRNRTITFDVEQGTLDEAKQLISEALEGGETPSLESTKAEELLLEVRKGRPDDKLAAFRQVVAKWQSFPADQYASDKTRRQYNQELNALQKTFFETPLDVKKNPRVAKEIIELFHEKIENKYSGQSYLELEQAISQLFMQMRERDD